MLLLKAVCTFILVNVAASIESTGATRTTSYDPGELLAKIFNSNSTVSSRQRGYGLVFEDQPDLDPQTNPDDHGQYGLITFEESQNPLFEYDPQNENSNRPLRFQDESSPIFDGNDRPLKDQRLVRDQDTFQDDNTIGQGNKRKRRRRRRKPKDGLQNYQGVPDYHHQGVPSRPGFPEPGFEPNPYPLKLGFGLNPNGNPGLPRPVPFRRRRRPRPSLASNALTAITGALTSIALYDDYQCVPRLLCEAAGGGSLGSNGVLDSIAGIQPLLTLLSVYNGISSSPLFVFGRAVFLGMTSQGNTGTCRYAYPQCPTDPEQLIFYLNNHNGGFFRFFNTPVPNQNLEQFYNHLGQNGQDLDQSGQFNLEQDYGQNQQFQQGQGSYGLYQNQQSGQGYGFQNNHIGNQRPSSYGQNYGSNYGYNTYASNVKFKDSNAKIEKRIQNKPVKDDIDSSEDNDNPDTKWQFPIDNNSNTGNQGQTYSLDVDDSDNDSLKFPEESQKYDDKRDYKRKGKSILFPENQHNHNAYSNKNYVNIDNQNNYNRGQYYHNDYNKVTTYRPSYQNNYKYQNTGYVNTYKPKPTTAAPFNENDYYYDQTHNFYVKKDQRQDNYDNIYNKYQNQLNNNNIYHNKEQNKVNYANYNNNIRSDNEDGTQTVYVVRGNGDPNRPEIVKVRPGQTVH